MAADATTQPTPVSYPWTPDQGDGAFRNPVICADYSDPDVIRDGDDFWLTASSFNCTPGLPILHSRDLVNWTIVNHALKNNPDPRGVFHLPRHGEGVWAPAIRKHAGKFWIFFPLPDEGIYVTTADDPRGQWSEPHLLIEGKGLIDPCPLWDDDGQAYLVHAYANSRAGIKHKLRVRPMAADGSKVLGEGQIVFDQPDRHPTCEGPKFHKKDGWYYISAPAGGVATGWQLILRSRNVYGPYEEKVVLEQGTTPINGPHQGAMVDTPSGEWWFVHFQELQPNGRIVHLQPVQWKDGWPLMGVDHDGNGVGEPVLRHRKPDVANPQPIAMPQTSDEFDGERLGLQWQWHANHRDDWHSLTARLGHLRLRAVPADADLRNVPNILAQKLAARAFAAETQVELSAPSAGVQAGLVVIGTEYAALMVERTVDGCRLLYSVNNETRVTRSLATCSARLSVTMQDGGLCAFAYAEPGGAAHTMGDPFQAVEGRWIGAKVGLFCRTSDAAGTDAYADFDYLRFDMARAAGP